MSAGHPFTPLTPSNHYLNEAAQAIRPITVYINIPTLTHSRADMDCSFFVFPVALRQPNQAVPKVMASINM